MSIIVYSMQTTILPHVGMNGSGEKDYFNNCIGSLEHHVHNVFASVRVPGEDFVYSASVELFNKLDDYCDNLPANRQETKPPLLIKGETGTGKSALLSNWIHRRERNSTRSKIHSPLGEEFMFWHAVGCSRQSMNANSLIRRLIVDLKNRFELARDIPKSQERLSWELPRFLELAAKKGRVIIVIDGLNRLVNNDNGEDGLTWLPLQFPPNVRFILSVTTPPSSYGENQKANTSEQNDKVSLHKNKKSRILQELDRRNVPCIILKPLDRNLCRSVVDTFISKTVNNENAALTMGPYVSHFLSASEREENAATLHTSTADLLAGFLLFDSQINGLLSHPEGGIPFFLRLFLRCMQFAVSRGYSSWFICEQWLLAQNVSELLQIILKTFEEGFVVTVDSAHADCDRTVAAGGLPALKSQYSWHPFFLSLKSSEYSSAVDNHRSSNTRSSIVSVNQSEYAPKSRISVNLQDSNLAASPGSFNAEMASDIVEGALKTMTLSTSSPTPTDKMASSSEARKAPAINTGGGKNVSQLVLQSLTDQEMNDVSQQADLKLQLALKQSLEIIEDAMLRTREKVEDVNSPTFMAEMIYLMKEAQVENTKSAGRDKQQRFSLREHPRKTIKPERRHLTFSIDDNEETESAAIDDLHNDNDSLNSMSSIEEKDVSGKDGFRGLKGHKFLSSNNSQPSPDRNSRHSFQQPIHQAAEAVDPSEGMHLLPICFRGGVTTVGFGDLLGNALALLYVSRQGLREKELWKILSLLQFRAEQSKRADITASKEVRMQQLEMTRQLANQLLMARGLLADIFRAEDTTHTGYISLSCIFNGIKKLYPDTSKADVIKLLEFIESNLKSSEEASSLQLGGRVHYDKMLKSLLKLNRQLKFNETKHSKVHLLKTSIDGTAANNEDEDDDYDNFNLKLSPNAKKALGSMKGDDGKQSRLKDEDGKAELDEDNYSLGPVIEESLLGILCAVGVLYSAENKLLILPSDSEPFRAVVFEKYILNRGGLQYWHQQLIQYFQTELNSLRRCEELPWHLKICRKWNTLRDTLVDLKTFDLMYNNDLKDELMDYWVLLTEGPLFVHDPKPELPSNLNNGQVSGKQLAKAAAAAAALSHDDSDVDSSDNILREIDRALELNTSLKEIRKHTLKNQIQPFDVVEELNKSVEQWVASIKPLPSVIHKVINQISRFMAEFSKLAKSSPRFLRVGIDLHSVALFGISFDEIKADIAVNHLSLTSSGDNDDRVVESKLLEPVYKEGPPQFPTEAMLSSGKKLYAYLRWVWIQFPWIALHPAGSIALNDTSGLGTSSESMVFSGEIGDDGLPIGAAIESYQGPTTNENERLQRVWNCKKTDPTFPVFQKSASRQLAALKPRAMTSLALEKSVEVALDSLYDEMMEEAESGGEIFAGAHLKNDRNPRYPDEAAKSKASLGESTDVSVTESSNRSKKSHGKGKTPKFDIEAALAGANTAANGSSNTFLTEVDEEIKHMSADEFIYQQEIQQQQLQEQKAQVKRNSKESQMKAYHHMLERIAKMKSIWNKLDIIHRDKVRTLTNFENQVNMRDESDAQLISDVNNGEALIKALGERNIAIERSLNDAKTINEGYLQLMKAVKNNAPFRESHVKSLEIELELAERQFKDLCHHRSTLYKDTDKMETIRKKEITDRISYFAHARSEIALKKIQVEDEIMHLQKELKSKKHSSSTMNFPPKTLEDAQKRKRGKRRAGDDSSSMASGSTKSSRSSSQPLKITKQLAVFMNVLTKKKMLNTPLIKEGDTLQSLREVDKFKPPSRDIVDPSSSMVVVDASQSLEVQSASLTGNFGSMFLKGTETVVNNRLRFVGSKSESDLSRPPTVVESQPSSRMQMRGQVQKLIKYVLDKTESSSVDNFLDRFHQNKKLVDILNNQQMLLDSRLSQLRTEHQELSTLHNDMSFVGEEEMSSELSVNEVERGGALLKGEEFPSAKKSKQYEKANVNSSGSIASTVDDQSSVTTLKQPVAEDDNDDRYIDSKLFSKEVRLRQMQLLNKNSVYIINEVRTAVAHLMNIIMLNEKLLSTLPKVSPPTLNDDSDIVVCLSWCEEKLIAVNEALSMESNKNSGANPSDEVKTLSQRQNELATLIMKSAAKDTKNKLINRSKSADKKNKKQQGGLSRNVINSNTTNLPLPNAVMVTSASKIDTVYDNKMAKLCSERDKRQDLIESKRMYAEGSENNNDLQKFLAGGIDIKSTKELTRKAGQLVNKRQGRQVNYGLVLQDLIVSKGQTVSLIDKGKTLTSPGSVKRAKNDPSSSSNWNAAAATTTTESNANAMTTESAAN